MLVEPFRCLRPRPDLAGRVAYAPFGAYDRSRAFAEAAANPLSFVSVDWPEALYALEEEVDLAAAHARARALLAYRLREGALVEDASPALYHYRFEASGHSQSAWVGRVPAGAFAAGEVRPHEATLAVRQADRAAHVRAVGAQTAPAFLMYRQTGALGSLGEAVRAGEPLCSFRLPDGSSHEVWRLEGRVSLGVSEAFGGVARAYVADGHHRAAAALSAGCPGVLCALFPSEELGVLPYDRLVLDLGGVDPDGLVEALGAAGFSPEPSPGPVSPARKGELGLFCAGRWWHLSVPGRLRGPGTAGSLDVSALQEGVPARLAPWTSRPCRRGCWPRCWGSRTPGAPGACPSWAVATRGGSRGRCAPAGRPRPSRPSRPRRRRSWRSPTRGGSCPPSRPGSNRSPTWGCSR